MTANDKKIMADQNDKCIDAADYIIERGGLSKGQIDSLVAIKNALKMNNYILLNKKSKTVNELSRQNEERQTRLWS